MIISVLVRIKADKKIIEHIEVGGQERQDSASMNSPGSKQMVTGTPMIEAGRCSSAG